MTKKIIELDGGKMTIEDMREEEFLKLHPNVIRIESEHDLEKLKQLLNSSQGDKN